MSFGRSATFSRVQTGLYAGFSKAEMLAEWARYKVELKSSSSRLTGASVNGQSYSFGPRSDLTLVEWSRQLRSALAQVDPDWIAPTGTIRTRFTRPGC